jgi:hypothetical protein
MRLQQSPPALTHAAAARAPPCSCAQATGSVSAAAVLADLHVRRVPHGGPEGMKRVAAGLIKVTRGGV